MKKTFALLTLGAILEYYDFAIFIYFAKNIGESLIPLHDQTANLIASFGILAIGALLRPFGGVVFAHFGDIYGRKNIFVYTVLLMAIPTFLIGFIPSYQTIGLAATIILIVLRSIQGLAIGGEIPGSVVFAYELSKLKNKALNTNIVIAGTNIGFFLASMLGSILLSRHISLKFDSWRIAFILGGVFGIISYYLRKSLNETPEFLQYKKFVERQPHLPFKELIKNHKINLLHIVLFGSSLASGLAVFTFFMPTFLSTYYHFSMPELLKYNSYSIIIFIFSAFFAGKFHFLLGKKFLVIGNIVFVIACFYLFTHYSIFQLEEIIFYHFFIIIYIGLICGRLPVLSASFFPVQVRYSGVSLSYNISFGNVAGLTQMLLFSLIKLTGLMWIPAAYIALFMLLSTISILFIPSQKLIRYT